MLSPFSGSLSLTLLLRPEGPVAELIAGDIWVCNPPTLSTLKCPNPGRPDQAVRQLEEWSERHQKSQVVPNNRVDSRVSTKGEGVQLLHEQQQQTCKCTSRQFQFSFAALNSTLCL